MRTSPFVIQITVRRSSGAARYRLWAEVDGDFGVALAQSQTIAGLRRNAIREIRRQWRLGWLGAKGGSPPEIVWHRSTKRYARLAGRELSELRTWMRESDRKAGRIERALRRAGAYAREARFIAHGQVSQEMDLKKMRRTGRLEVVPWNP